MSDSRQFCICCSKCKDHCSCCGSCEDGGNYPARKGDQCDTCLGLDILAEAEGALEAIAVESTDQDSRRKAHDCLLRLISARLSRAVA